MIVLNDAPNVQITPGDFAMKKLMTLMLGLSLALGSVAVAFSQDTTKKETTKKAKKAPKKTKKDTTEKK
jgi:hypothetical protein